MENSLAVLQPLGKLNAQLPNSQQSRCPVSACERQKHVHMRTGNHGGFTGTGPLCHGTGGRHNRMVLTAMVLRGSPAQAVCCVTPVVGCSGRCQAQGTVTLGWSGEWEGTVGQGASVGGGAQRHTPVQLCSPGGHLHVEARLHQWDRGSL